MTPRDRALAAAARIEAAHEEIHSDLEIWEEVIRDAENDALERAAREAENTPHARWFRIAPHIRALKHKGSV